MYMVCMHVQESVYFSSPEEGDVAAMLRILKMSNEEVEARVDALTRLREALYLDNNQTASAILQLAWR